MKQQQLIPKRRRKRQPTAECMREQLRLAADEIIRLRLQAEPKPVRVVWPPPGAFVFPPPWPRRTPDPPSPLRRLWHRIAARLRKEAS